MTQMSASASEQSQLPLTRSSLKKLDEAPAQVGQNKEANKLPAKKKPKRKGNYALPVWTVHLPMPYPKKAIKRRKVKNVKCGGLLLAYQHNTLLNILINFICFPIWNELYLLSGWIHP